MILLCAAPWSSLCSAPHRILLPQVVESLEHTGLHAWLRHRPREALARWLPAAWLAEDATRTRNILTLIGARRGGA